MTTNQVDSARAEAFAGNIVGMFNQGMLSLMVSIGHRTGLFDTLAGLPPSTSAEVAAAAGLNERYVREWLGAMVTGRIVDYDGASRRYALPAEHARSLVRAAGPNNLALLMQYVGLLASVEGQVIDCFRRGGGVPYAAFGAFQTLQGEESAAIHDASLVDGILPLVPGLPERLRAGIDALDLGCGMGHAVNLIARAFPRSRVTGIDFSEEGTAAGRAEARRWGLTNATFEAADAARLGRKDAYDLITTFDCIHDQADPAAVLRNIRDALRDDGVYLCVDIAGSSHLADNIDHPLAPALYTVSCMHCMTVSLAQGGRGLGAMWGEELALQMLAEAGFPSVEVKKVEGDIMNNYYIARKR